MGFPRATALLALALLATACGKASAGLLPGLLTLSVVPPDCGYVVQVKAGDTCQSLADWAGISMTNMVQMNPLALCGILTPAPGALMCVGGKSSFCSNFYRTVAGDTLGSIQSTLGTVLGGLGGLVGGNSIAPDTLLCVRPSANKCDVDSLCGVPLSDDMRVLLGLASDWCNVLSECKAPLSATTVGGLPSVMATLSDVTPAVAQVVGNEGHPELRDFVKQRTAGPAQLQIAFTPNARGAGQHASSFAISTGGTGRKLLAGVSRMGSPGYRPYY